MLRASSWLLFLAMVGLALPRAMLCQSEVDSGSVNGNIYTNQFFGLTWEFPKEWTVADSGQKSESQADTRLARLLPSGPQSTESVELSYVDLGSSNVENPAQELNGKGWEGIEGHGYYMLGGGVPAHRYDYKSNDPQPGYLTLLAGPRRNFGLRVFFRASSPDRIQGLVNAALAMKIQPDWPAGAQGNPIPPTAPGSRPKRVRVSQGVSQGLLEHKVQPTYPTDARKAHVQGSVVMLGRIGTSGAIECLYVEEGDPLLAASALEAVSQWKYRPYLLNGEPVEVETQLVVNFELR